MLIGIKKSSNRKQHGQGTWETYRAEKKSLQILLSSTQAGTGRKVKQEQEEISHNHVPRFFLSSVQGSAKRSANLAKQDPGTARQNS